jgi:hypothetical protein
MFANYRRYVYALFTLFFVLVTPFLIIYSLGFEINLDQQKISNTLNINIETLPRGASIKNKGFDIGKTPLEMKAGDGQQIPIKVESDGYKSEEFVFWTAQNTNGSARVTNLSLLPSNWDEITNFDSDEPVGILSSSLILFKNNQQFFVQGYNLGGLVGKKSQVDKTLGVSVQTTTWELLSENIYWDRVDNLILAYVGDIWKFVDLSGYPVQAKNIVSTSENQMAILDQSGSLWTLDLGSQELSFLESQVDGIYKTIAPDNIWVWKEGKIFRLSKGYIDNTFFSLEGKLYSQNKSIERLRGVDDSTPVDDFYVASVFQGVMFKVENLLYYVPDFDKNIWQVISTNVERAGVDTNTIIWLDKETNLFSYNFVLKEEQGFGKIPLSGNPNTFRLGYYYTWRRVIVYSDKEVYSVWFDKDIINRNVVKYNPVKWIELNCLPKIVDRFQFCLTDKKLVAYKNTSFF